MIKLFSKILKKEPEQKEVIDHALRLLNIPLPYFKEFDVLVNAGKVYGLPEYSEEKIRELEVSSFWPLTFIAGMYNEETHEMSIAKRMVADPEDPNHKLVKLSPGEQLFVVLHELRHIWQKENGMYAEYRGQYRETPHAVNPAEIDADAFAIALMLHHGASQYDFPTLYPSFDNDQGKRKQRIAELSQEYNLNLSF